MKWQFVMSSVLTRRVSHSHMYIKSTEKHLFKDMKKLLKKNLNVRAADIARPINMRECIKYITKQDTNAIVINIPLKHTSTVYQGRLYAEQGHSSVVWSDYIPSQISPSERKVFENVVSDEKKRAEYEDLNCRLGGIKLRTWQQELLETVKDENINRTVFSGLKIPLEAVGKRS